jgi:hypothetical protein
MMLVDIDIGAQCMILSGATYINALSSLASALAFGYVEPLQVLDAEIGAFTLLLQKHNGINATFFDSFSA